MAVAPRVVIIGGGIAGCAVAIELLTRGSVVTVVDRERPGRGATGASAGMLTPQYESPGPTPDFRLGVQSRLAWPGFAERLERLCGTELVHRTDGMLVANRDAEEEDAAHATLRYHHEVGLQGEVVTPAEARKVHPGVARDAPSWLWLPDEGQIDVQRLADALGTGVRAAGGDVVTGVAVERIESAASRVKGVRLTEGTVLHSDLVVVAAGAWSDQVGGLPRSLPVRPVRGQMVRLRPADPLPWTLVADHGGHYVVPRMNGTVLVGSTMEDIGFDATATVEARETLFTAGRALIPDLSGAEVVEHWCGFRPISSDGAPILGPDPDIEGLFYATGAGRRGILLAPLIGRIVADLAITGATSAEWTDFSVTRFDVARPVR